MDYEKLYKDGDRSIKTIVEYAIHLKNTGKIEEALATLEEGVEKYPTSSLLYTLIGKIHLQENEFEKALITLKKAYNLDKFNYQAIVGLVKCFRKLGLKRNKEYFEKVAFILYPFKETQEGLPGSEELEKIAEEGRDLIE